MSASEAVLERAMRRAAIERSERAERSLEQARADGRRDAIQTVRALVADLQGDPALDGAMGLGWGAIAQILDKVDRP